MATIRTLTTIYKILETLMADQIKGPKEIAGDIDRVPGTVSNNMVFMHHEGLIKRIDYGKYVITDFGRKEYARLSQSLKDQSSRRTE